MAKERRKLGYTKHLEVAGKLALEQARELFKKWNIDMMDTLFIVDPYDLKLEILLKMRIEDVDFGEAIEKAMEFLRMKNVGEVGIVSYDGAVLAETEETGNVVYIMKKGKEYLVEDYYHF